MYSFLMVLMGLVMSWLIGYPLTYYALNRRSTYLSNDALHALSVFVGFAIVVCIELILVGFNIPVIFTAYPVLMTSIVVFGLLLKKKIITIIPPSRLFILGALGVVIVSGFSLFILGHQYYKGYAWWDTLYYGSHAEFLKTTSFNQLDTLVYDNPYLGASYHYFHGAHRIGRGVYQAFIASIFFVDGASTIGYMNVYGTALVYFGVIYCVDGFNISRKRRILMAFAASIVPNVIITQLEGFIPIGLFSAFVLVIVRIYLDYFKQSSIVTGVLVGLLSAAFMTTLLDGTYIIIGMYILSIIISLFTKNLRFRNLIYIVIPIIVVFISIFHYQEQFAVELSGSVIRSSLNFIYDFANSPLGLNWIFWGRTLTQAIVPNSLFLVLTFLSISCFFASFVGIFMILYQLRREEGLTMLAMMLMPFIFWSLKDGVEVLDLRYSYFKLLTFAVPVLIIGLFYFFNLVLLWAKESWQNEQEKGYKHLYKCLHGFLQLCVYGLVGAFVISSVERVSVPLRVEAFKSAGIVDRASYLLRYNDDNAQRIYETLSTENQNILLVSEDVDLGFWWATYYGRNNNLFALSNNTYKTYIKDQPEVDLSSIPLDSVIVYTPNNAKEAMVPEEYQDKLAFVMKTEVDGRQVIHIKKRNTFEADSFSFLIFSKETHQATVSMDISIPSGEPVVINDGSRMVEIIEDGTYTFNIDVKSGAQEITFDFNDAPAIIISNVEYSK